MTIQTASNDARGRARKKARHARITGNLAVYPGARKETAFVKLAEAARESETKRNGAGRSAMAARIRHHCGADAKLAMQAMRERRAEPNRTTKPRG